ncbi:MAG: hypothetical protein Q8L54_02675 [Devosia sp.]|nr:hypothetical protein [Devosia sp.]
MLGMLILMLAVVAIAAWLVAVYSAVRIAGLVTAGQRLNIWFRLGLWRFDKVRTLAGDASIPHIKRYIQGFLAFFAAIIAAMVITASAAITTPDAAATAGQSHLPMSFEIPNSSSLES